MKLYDRSPMRTGLPDKLLARDWVKEKIGEEYLAPLLGDSFDEIDFSRLPTRFALKTNHGCAYNLIVTDKALFDMEASFMMRFALKIIYYVIE